MVAFLNGVAIIYLFACLQTLRQWQQNWRQFWDDEVSLMDQALAQRLAIFVLLPLGVLLHELGHALAVQQVGGVVQSFRWLFAWGYVIPKGEFNPLQWWWIALSGNLISILLASIALAFIPRIRKRILAEVLFFFAVAEYMVSLVVYPLLSLSAGWGDWIKIYNPSLQPYATLTLLAHGALLVALWRLYTSAPALHWRLARNPAVASEWRRLAEGIEQQPRALALRLAQLDLLLQHNEIQEARRLLPALLALGNQEAPVQLMRARLAAAWRDPRRAIRLCQPLLTTTIAVAEQQQLHATLSAAYYNLGNLNTALIHADQALQLAPHNANHYTTRALIQLRRKQLPQALADCQAAIALLPTKDHLQQLQNLERLLQRKHRATPGSNVQQDRGAQPGGATRKGRLTTPQRWLVILALIPLIGLPFCCALLLWGWISWSRNGKKLLAYAVLGLALSVLSWLVFLVYIFPYFLFHLLPYLFSP